VREREKTFGRERYCEVHVVCGAKIITLES
jgi:hypothetical protein